jgi:glycosyltransferase involved in cell wall biosynthesis
MQITPQETRFPPVGYIIKMFPRLSETFILNEILELEAQGLALRIFSMKRPTEAVAHEKVKTVKSPIRYLPETFRQSPLRIVSCQCHVWRRFPKAWRRQLRNAVRRSRSDGDSSDLTAFFQACCVVREMGDVRHFHAHYANVPAKLALLVQRLSGCSYSITTHAKDIFQNDPFASAKLLERMGRARFIVANSRFSAAHIRTGLNGQGKIRVVYNGLDLKAFPLRKTEPERPALLGVGRLVEKKGFSDLVHACQILKSRGLKFCCEIVGTGAGSAQLKEQIRSCQVGDCIQLVGPLPQEVLRERYERAMVFVLPCVRAKDGDRDILPNVIKEAMAVGVPVVTSRLEGIDELVEDEVSGLLVEPGDVTGLAARIERLLREPQLRLRLSRGARVVIEERFDRRINFAQLRNLLTETFEHPQPEVSHSLVSTTVEHDAHCIR